MKYNVIITSSFERDVRPLLKKYKSLKEDLTGLIELLKKEPVQGNALGKDCYKIRLSITSKRRGKSGGARLITCLKIKDKNVFLLTIYDKSEKEDISDKELNQLLKYI